MRSGQDDLIEGLRLAAVAVLCAGVTASLAIGLGGVMARRSGPAALAQHQVTDLGSAKGSKG